MYFMIKTKATKWNYDILEINNFDNCQKMIKFVR